MLLCYVIPTGKISPILLVDSVVVHGESFPWPSASKQNMALLMDTDITKTYLFKYTEIFTTNKWKFSGEKF